MPRNIPPRERLIVALDMPAVEQAERLVAELGDSVVFYKVGMELAYGGGLPFVEKLAAAGKKVFLDLKLHDIPNTVERAVAQVAKLGATFLTIHAYPQTMRAAVAGREGSGLKLLAVSVLTSCDDADLREAGYAFGVEDLVARRGAQAQAERVDGLVASPAEAARLRARSRRRSHPRHPGHSPRGRGGRRPETHRDARAGHCGRRGLSGGRPAGDASGRSARSGGGDCRRDRRGRLR